MALMCWIRRQSRESHCNFTRQQAQVKNSVMHLQLGGQPYTESFATFHSVLHSQRSGQP